MLFIYMHDFIGYKNETSMIHDYVIEDNAWHIVVSIDIYMYCIVRRHLLDNLDDKPADETQRAPVKNKISFPYCFFLFLPTEPVLFLVHCTD